MLLKRRGNIYCDLVAIFKFLLKSLMYCSGQGANNLIAIEDSHAHMISYDNKAPH